ncbi:MAG: flavodoxin-dependent (E)-4-hydroxy-3-methylbut-2-enyl-diphosphate synthase [Oscillospiraceae bacterium]
MIRKKTKEVKIGNVSIGGNNDIAVQSMLSVRAEDMDGNIAQAIELEKAGCQILRVALPTLESVALVDKIKSKISIPLVADIHFDYKIALEACNAGIDKIRINPGNIGSDDRIKAVAIACKNKNIPIRIGINGGCVEKEILKKYGRPTPEALVESARYHCELLEKYDFNDIVIAIKSSDVATMIESYRLASQIFDYPLHLGVTEAGTKHMGILKSAIGIGSLLCDGIGDTIRVTLTENPIEEIAAGFDIIKASGRRKGGVNIISCPTCGRTKINLIELAKKVEDALKDVKKDITVAVMGCAVNGPGEAREADIGIAGGDGNGLIFKKGEIIEKVDESRLLERLLYHINQM